MPHLASSSDYRACGRNAGASSASLVDGQPVSSGHQLITSYCKYPLSDGAHHERPGMSALPPKADIRSAKTNDRYGPKADTQEFVIHQKKNPGRCRGLMH